MPEISRMSGPGPAPLARAIHFHLKNGKSRDFEGAVEKIHAALSKRDWPNYVWYDLVDGGYSPTYVVVLPRADWAGFAPGETTFGAAIREEYGDEAAGIFEALSGSVAKQWSETIAYRPDLSYVPASE
jgi:hypothetical protein